MNVVARFALLAIALAVFAAPAATADDAQPIDLAGGKIQLTPPADWDKKQPSSRIVEHEFSVSPAEGDNKNSRVTIMQAGGGVGPNIARWKAQFKNAESKTNEKQVAEQAVHYVDIKGDYQNPFRPSDGGANYRMLGAIISTEKLGDYYVKFYGPARTVDENEKAFYQMIDSLKVK